MPQIRQFEVMHARKGLVGCESNKRDKLWFSWGGDGVIGQLRAVVSPLKVTDSTGGFSDRTHALWATTWGYEMVIISIFAL